MKKYPPLPVFPLLFIMACGGGGGGDDTEGVVVAADAADSSSDTEADSDNGGADTPSTQTPSPGSWGTATIISSASSQLAASSLYLTSPAAGEAFAVWLQKDASRQRVMAARFADGSWGTVAALDGDPGVADGDSPCGSTVGGEPCVPSVASPASGEAFAVWQQQKGGRVRILSARYTSGTWSEAGVLDLETLSTHAGAPIVVSRGAGEAFAAWIQSDGTTPRVYAAAFANGGWGGAAPVDPVTGTVQVWSIALVSPGNGEAHLIWSQGTAGGAQSVLAARYSGGIWGSPQTLDAATGIADDGNAATTEGTYPQIASGAAGSAYAVWLHVDSDTVRRVYASRWADGTWNTSQAIDPGVNSVATSPIVASPSASQAFAVWAQHDGTAVRTWQSQFAAGNWQSARKLSPLDSTRDVTSAPLVTSRTAGRAYAVWEQSDGTSLRTWAAIFANEAWGLATAIDAATPANGVAGSFVVGGGNDAVAGWLENDGTSVKVYAVTFASGE